MANYTEISDPYNNSLAREPGGLSFATGGQNTESGVAEQTQSAPQAGGNTAASSSVGGGPAQQASVASGGAIADITIEHSIQSKNWSPKKVGFRIDGQTGYAEFTDVYVSGDIRALTGTIGGWTINATTLTGGSATLDSSGVLTLGTTNDVVIASAADATYRLWVGHATAASASFSVTKAGGLYAISGTIGGNVLSSTTISSTTFVSGPLGSGWNISNTGTAEFQNVIVRGTIRTSVFEKDTISAVNGMVLISKADVLGADMTALDSSTLTISGETTFVANEVLRIKDGTNDEWMLVTSAASAPIYTVTRDLAASYSSNSNPIWKKGTAVVSMGVGTGTKTGFVLLDSSSTNSPYIDIYGRISNTYDDYGQAITHLPNVRLGWLKGIVDASVGLNSTDVWGLYSSSVYLTGTINATSGFFGSVGDGATIDSTGVTLVGDGYIRTNSSGARVELVKSLTGGYTSALVGYNSADALVFRLAMDGGSPMMSLMGGSSYTTGMQITSTNTSNGVDAITITEAGVANGIKITTSGSTARSANAALQINNTSTNGYGAYIIGGSDTTGELLHIEGVKQGGDLTLVSYITPRTNHRNARITVDNYLQFPAYYHCSEFDEDLSGGDTALASTVIAKAYWVGGGTAGTQILQGSDATEDNNSYIELSTTSTASRTSTLTFGRFVNATLTGAIEFRFKVSSITNTKINMGLALSTTDYAMLTFDTDLHASRFYTETRVSSGTIESTQRTTTLSASIWVTVRIQIYATGTSFYVNETLIGTNTTALPVANSLKPYFYIDNKAASEEKLLNIDYVKVWTGRKDT